MWEWADWTLGGSLTSGPTSCSIASTEFPSVSCGALTAADYMPGNPGGVTAANYDRNYGLGNFFGGSGGASRRSGAWNSATVAGVFTLNMTSNSSGAGTTLGFRCVFRP